MKFAKAFHLVSGVFYLGGVFLAPAADDKIVNGLMVCTHALFFWLWHTVEEK